LIDGYGGSYSTNNNNANNPNNQINIKSTSDNFSKEDRRLKRINNFKKETEDKPISKKDKKDKDKIKDKDEKDSNIDNSMDKKIEERMRLRREIFKSEIVENPSTETQKAEVKDKDKATSISLDSSKKVYKNDEKVAENDRFLMRQQIKEKLLLEDQNKKVDNNEKIENIDNDENEFASECEFQDVTDNEVSEEDGKLFLVMFYLLIVRR